VGEKKNNIAKKPRVVRPSKKGGRWGGTGKRRPGEGFGPTETVEGGNTELAPQGDVDSPNYHRRLL